MEKVKTKHRKKFRTALSYPNLSKSSIFREVESASRPLQDLEVAALRRFRARPLVPRASVFARPLQHRQLTALRCVLARLLVPRAVVLARPLQDIEVAALRCVLARLLVPRAVVLARPLQDIEVAALRRFRARPRAPRASVFARPLQDLEVVFPSSRASPRRRSHPTMRQAGDRRRRIIDVHITASLNRVTDVSTTREHSFRTPKHPRRPS